MQLKNYQEKAVDELVEKSRRLLGYGGGKKLVFKAPTGSGKTIMMAEFLKRLVDDREIKTPLSFLWTAPRHLHTQSKEKLEDYFETSRTLTCSYFHDLSNRKIDENEILFFNWSSVNKKDKNTIVRENEQEFYLSKVLDRTREEGRKVILIIDESHYSSGQMDKTEKSAAAQLRRDIAPDLTIEVSATPLMRGDDDVNVQIEDVKAEAMIKRGVIINEGFTSLIKGGKITTSAGKDSNELVLGKALAKREELKKAFAREGTAIDPLVLIQLPDRKGALEDEMKEEIIKLLKLKFRISTDNHKLAIWVSGEHVNKDEVAASDSTVEVLLFKQAIALGWDCPRAQILVVFRKWHKAVFSIQTLGRVMRMPEPEKGDYYTNDALNYAYVYTNLADIAIDQDIASGYASVVTSRRVPGKLVDLPSYHTKRQREKTRLAPAFIDIFLAEAKTYNLKKQIDRAAKKINQKIIADYTAKNIDAMVGGPGIVADRAIVMSEHERQQYFEFFVRECLRSQLYPEDRSVGRVKESIYDFFEDELGMDRVDDWDDIIAITLNEENGRHIAAVVNRAVETYVKEMEKKARELVCEDHWDIPVFVPCGCDMPEQRVKKSIMQPACAKFDSRLEEAFVNLLEHSSKVVWWFRNGDRDATFFAIPYKDGSGEAPFYVDFIVKMKGGNIGLFDPHDPHLGDFDAKASGLARYIKSVNLKKRNVVGGLVANTDPKNFRGRWVWFNPEKKGPSKDDFATWEDLKL